MPKLIPCKKTADCYYQDGHEGKCERVLWPTADEMREMNKEPKQIGGDHYKYEPIQPWEVIQRAGLDFWEGSVVKYVMRYRRKGGIVDLEKAIHNLEYMIEREKNNGKA